MIQILIPAAAVLVALVLYFRKPSAYVSFSLWVWFLAPLVRRLVDWQLGWHEQSLILLAPLLVAAVSGLSILVPSQRRPFPLHFSLWLCIAGVVYGFVVGMVLDPGLDVAFGLLNWLTPLLFGAHLALESQHYQQNRSAILKTFMWAAGLLGIYGIYQFFVAPAWDSFWLQNVSAGLIDPSFGEPEPMKMRVWSTLNSPGTFAGAMSTALIFMTASVSALTIPFAAAGYVAFLLTSVRAAWLGWALGLALVLRRARPKLLLRVGGSLVLLAALVIPIVRNMHDFAPGIADRFSSFSDLKTDASFRERQDMYRVVTGYILHDPYGRGLKSQETVNNLAVDSGILATLLSLGWTGTLLYLSGVLIAMLQSAKSKQTDPFVYACRAICLSALAQYVGASIFPGINGIIFWLCAGTAMAGTEGLRSATKVKSSPSRVSADLPQGATQSL